MDTKNNKEKTHPIEAGMNKNSIRDEGNKANGGNKEDKNNTKRTKGENHQPMANLNKGEFQK